MGGGAWGYSYTHQAAGVVAASTLAPAVRGLDAMDVARAWSAMVAQVRNHGRPALASAAIAAVDVALWDLKARLCGLSLVSLLGAARQEVPVYGSGGFTSYSEERLARQFGGWVAAGIPRVKMKVGRRPDADAERVAAARAAVGDGASLFVDANGGYDRKQALACAATFAHLGVTWFEEPVSSDDLEGLALVRDRAPAAMEVAAAEYGYDAAYFHRMLAAGAVDVLQADATRCGGITGFLDAAALCRSRSLPLSAHTAPSLHAHPGAAASPLRHVEYFHDHVVVERVLFEGVLGPRDGALWPDRDRPGHGLELRRADAERFAA